MSCAIIRETYTGIHNYLILNRLLYLAYIKISVIGRSILFFEMHSAKFIMIVTMLAFYIRIFEN